MFDERSTQLTVSIATIVLLASTLVGCRSAIDKPTSASSFVDEVELSALSRIAEDSENTVAGVLGKESFVVAEESVSDSPSDNDFVQTAGATIASQEENLVSQTAFASTGSNVRMIGLQEVLQLAIEHSQFITDAGSFLSGGNPLLNDPQFLQSTFDLDLQQASQQGVEAALASFDARVATGLQWGRNSVLQANSNLLSSDLLINDNANFYGRLDKPYITGSTFSLIHNLNYANDQSSFPLDPRYTGFVRGEIRHPLLAGRGRRFTEIAGPNSYRNRQSFNGLALAEISEQVAKLDFRIAAARLLVQVEQLYWDYWLAVESFTYQQRALENANQIWTRIRNRADKGLNGGSAAELAQAEENFFHRQSLTDSALVEMEQAAARLKHLTGLSTEPGVILQPSDHPAGAPFAFDVDSSIGNGLNNRMELAKQDLQIIAIEKQLFGARQLNRPQLDLVSGVQLNGLGDDLFDAETGALPALFDTDDVGWNVGFEFSMPLGFRREQLNVRYLDLLLAKATTARCAQEKEIAHEIAYIAQTVDKWNRSLNSTRQRLAAAQRRLQALEVDFQAGRANLDLLLRSQDAVAQAQLELARTVAELTKAQIDLLFRQGIVAFDNS